ncbi:uncharacterized protein LOC115996984 [Ipomoea triloba]|uniref:uncharacterized protein LOC115996984 n=1 Tax=Ipomoea triloba TaxID=35885 RepID=UPI00125CE962|nr:uncharacterized protein LOC115996984 [Ipomoea triloba]
MASHDMVCNGVRRRIRDGKSTLIWGHPWLPDDPSPMIQTTMPAGLNGSLVSGLIDEGSGMWDHTILTDIFLPNDVNRILKIPISPGYEDSWFWYGDPRGCYSVKNGYRYIMGECDNNPMVFDRWNLMWKIKVPPKWKIFLRRALNDILPVTTTLALKRVEVDLSCPKCGLTHEDVMHALLLCDYSQLVWNEFTLPLSSISGDTFTQWFSNVLISLTEEDVGLVVAALYFIWRARNTALWDHNLPTPRKVLLQASKALNDWRGVHCRATATAAPPQHIPMQPAVQLAVSDGTGAAALNLQQCYFDAGYQPDSAKATFGAVLFSQEGEFVSACAGALPDCFNPFMAEANACKRVLLWLQNMGITSVQLLTDCIQLRSVLTTVQPSF